MSNVGKVVKHPLLKNGAVEKFPGYLSPPIGDGNTTNIDWFIIKEHIIKIFSITCDKQKLKIKNDSTTMRVKKDDTTILKMVERKLMLQ